jgi:nicotinamide-nucleotide amidase
LIATLLSEAPGAADNFVGAYVGYTADQKRKALGVDASLLETCGTVSAEVTKALAEGALARSVADLAIAVTGVTGPDTDEKGNPIGLFFLAAARSGVKTACHKRNLGDIGRSTVRRIAAKSVLELITHVLTGSK